MTARADLVVVGRIATLAGPDGPALGRGDRDSRGAGGRRRARVDDVEAVAGPGTRAPRARATTRWPIPGLTDAHLHLADAALERSRVDARGLRVDRRAGRRVRVAAAARAPATTSWIEGGGLGPGRARPMADRRRPGARRAGPAGRALGPRPSRAAGEPRGARGGRRRRRVAPTRDGGVIRRDADRPRDRRPARVGRAPRDARASRRPTRRRDRRRAACRSSRELLALGVVAVHDPGGLSARDRPRRADRGLPGARRGRRRWRCASTPASAPEQLDAAGRSGLRSGQPLGPDPLDRLRLGLAQDVRRRLARARARRPCSSRWSPGAGEPPPPNDGLGVWLVAARAAARRRRRGPRRSGSRPRSTGSATPRSGPRSTRWRRPSARRRSMPRVEHAQLVDRRRTSPRFAALGHRRVGAAGAPALATSTKARRLWGERADARGVPARPRSTRTGALVAFGTDAPVEPIDPWPGIACAVTRAAPSWPAGTPPLGPAQALSLWRAIRAACVDPAISAGEARPGPAGARAPRGRRRAARRRRSTSRSRSAGRCGTRDRGWCWSTARSSRRERPVDRRSAQPGVAAVEPARLREQPVEDPRRARERVDRLGEDVDRDPRLDRDARTRGSRRTRPGRPSPRRPARASRGRRRSSRARSRPRPSSPWRSS